MDRQGGRQFNASYTPFQALCGRLGSINDVFRKVFGHTLRDGPRAFVTGRWPIQSGRRCRQHKIRDRVFDLSRGPRRSSKSRVSREIHGNFHRRMGLQEAPDFPLSCIPGRTYRMTAPGGVRETLRGVNSRKERGESLHSEMYNVVRQSPKIPCHYPNASISTHCRLWRIALVLFKVVACDTRFHESIRCMASDRVQRNFRARFPHEVNGHRHICSML